MNRSHHSSHNKLVRSVLHVPQLSRNLTSAIPATVGGAVKSEPASFTLTAFAIATGVAQATLSVSDLLWLAALGLVGAAVVAWLQQEKKWLAAVGGGLFVGVLLGGALILGTGRGPGGIETAGGSPTSTSSTMMPTTTTDPPTPSSGTVLDDGSHRVRLSKEAGGAMSAELFDGDLLITASEISPAPEGSGAYWVTFTLSDLTGVVPPKTAAGRGVGQQVGFGPGCRYLVTVREVTDFWAVVLVSERPPSPGGCPS